MDTEAIRPGPSRPGKRRGIALGPILFIVSILAVVAGVIASTTGVFNTASGSERARMHGNAIIEQANQMKLGVQRMLGNGVTVGTQAVLCSTWNAMTNTGSAPELYLYWALGGQCENWGRYALFDPQGGNVNRPTPPADALPSANRDWATVAWQFVKNADIPNVGRADGDFVAAIEVTKAVCVQINDILFNTAKNGIADNPPRPSSGVFTAFTGQQGTAANRAVLAASADGSTFTWTGMTGVAGPNGSTANIPTGATAAEGELMQRSEGCLEFQAESGANANDGKYLYYKVLSVN